MDLIRLNICYAFLHERIRPTWQSVRFGLQHGLIDPEVPRELALEQIAGTAAPPRALLDIASADRSDLITQLLDRLVVDETESTYEQLRAEWLYLALAWTYEHRKEYSDPLQRVEEIYADFGYPERIASFVRYMPMDGPDLGSREANEQRLFERWRRYLDESVISGRA